MASTRLAATRAEYNDLSATWILNRDAYDNAGGFLNGDHLIQYVRESAEAFKRRKERAYFPNYAKDVAVTLSGHLFKKPAERNFQGIVHIEAFAKSTNLKGDITLQEFMKKAHLHSFAFGYCMVVVDKPVEAQDNLKEELEQGNPYAYIVDPLDMLDWEIDDAGNFEWVKFKETYRTNPDQPLGEHEVKTRYRIWTKEDWALYSSDNDTPIEQGKHGLGRVPVVMIRHEESLKYEDIGTSTFSSIVKLVHRLYNAISEKDNILLGSTFPILTIPVLEEFEQKADENDTSSEKNQPALGVGSLITYDPDSRHAPAFINHDGKPVENYDTLIDSLIKQSQQLARLEFTGGTYASGVAMAFDFEKTNQALKSKAATLQDAELAILGLVDLWMDGAGIEKVIIDYPEEFNIMDVEQTLKNIFGTLELNISKRFNEEVKKKASRQLLPALPDATQKIIDDEIEEGDKPIDDLDGEGDDE